LDIEPQLFQQITGDQRLGVDQRLVDGVEDNDLLALVAGFGDQLLRFVEIALAGHCFRAEIARHRRSAGEERGAHLPVLRVASVCAHKIRLTGNRQYRLAHLHIVEGRQQLIEAQASH